MSSPLPPSQSVRSSSYIRCRVLMTCRLLPLLVGLVLLATPLAGAAQDAPSLEDLKDRYDRLEGLRASFTQILRSEFSDDSTRIQGRVVLSGAKYRVETPSQTVVTNGTTTWIYSPADSQVVINDAESSESTVTPQTFLTTSAKNYKITQSRSTTRRGVPHSVLSLKAADKGTRFKSATLWVRRSDRIVTRLRATDRNGSILDLRLNDIAVNPSLDGEPFVFSAPTNVEVVDLRATSSE